MPHVLLCILLLVVSISPAFAQDDSLRFTYIDMINSSDGWGVSGDEDTIFVLNTYDGGQTWQQSLVQQIDPNGNLNDARYVEAFFLDADHAWLSFPRYRSIWMTRDGGETWNEVAIDLVNFGLTHGILQFADDQYGWFLGLNCCAASNESATLYQTTDGGASWEVINNDEAGRGLISDYHTGMSFADSTHGWMSKSSISAVGWVSFTNDGGLTWQPADLPAPEDRGLDDCDMRFPFVFSAQEILFLTQCRVENSVLAYLYQTSDGGASWEVAPVITEQGIHLQPQLYMLSPSVGWLLAPNETFESLLYMTQDGGRNWNLLPSLPTAFNDLIQWDFVDEQQGWAVTGSGEAFRTEDGGQSWEPLTPNIDTP